jgi:integrase
MPRKRRTEGSRAPNGASSIYLGSDGRWHGRVTMGVRDDGKPDRPHVSAGTEAEVIEKVRKLERQRDDGVKRRPGRAQTVAAWLTHWVEHIAAPTVRYKTLAGYRTAVYRHLIPGLGAHRIDRIEPEHFEKLYAKMTRAGLKPATVHQVHRTARTAFGEAMARDHIGRNPVSRAKYPRVEEEEVEPFDVEDVQRLITAALKRRNGVRFVLALALGTRQGETLALRWSRLDPKTRGLRIRRGLQRHTWQHGCDDPHACGAQRHKTEPCRPGCQRHTRACPPPCPPDCTAHARGCPQRHGGGLVEVEVKSRAGKRGLALPEPLYLLLEAHRATQAAEREHAGTAWHGQDFMFTQPDGKPIDPRADRAEWKALLAAAGVRDARLHDARHTAATVLLLLGVSERAVMGFMGWSNTGMTKRYQHITEAVQRDLADRIGGYLWQANETETETSEPDDDGE